MKKTASAPFVFLKKSLGPEPRSARKRAPTPTRDLSAEFERESEASVREEARRRSSSA